MSRIQSVPRKSQRGFTLLELLVVVAILGVIVGVAVRIVNQMVRTNNNVTNTVDVVQQGRQFMDQITADIHMGGYPGYKMFDQSSTNKPLAYQYAGNDTTAYPGGLTAASGTSMQFEGDVDNSGTVSVIVLQLCKGSGSSTCTAPAANSDCPCTMQRGTISKQSYLNGNAPSYYTELTGVLNMDVFTYWDYTGAQVTDFTNLSNIRTVRFKIQVQSGHRDTANGQYTVATLDSEAKLSN